MLLGGVCFVKHFKCDCIFIKIKYVYVYTYIIDIFTEERLGGDSPKCYEYPGDYLYLPSFLQ